MNIDNNKSGNDDGDAEKLRASFKCQAAMAAIKLVCGQTREMVKNGHWYSDREWRDDSEWIDSVLAQVPVRFAIAVEETGLGQYAEEEKGNLKKLVGARKWKP